MRVRAPIRVRPAMHTCVPISTPAASSTSLPIVESGPTVTSSASLAPGSTTAVGWIFATRCSALRVVFLDDQVRDVERFARVEQPRGVAAQDHREAGLLARGRDHFVELLQERPLEALAVELELALECLLLVLELVAQLGEIELLLEQRLVREREPLLLQVVLETLVLVEHRLELRLGLALLAGQLLASRLALGGRGDGELDVDHADLDSLVLGGGPPDHDRRERE